MPRLHHAGTDLNGDDLGKTPGDLRQDVEESARHQAPGEDVATWQRPCKRTDPNVSPFLGGDVRRAEVWGEPVGEYPDDGGAVSTTEPTTTAGGVSTNRSSL